MQPRQCLDQNPFPRTGFAMDEHRGVEAGRGKDGAVFGMGPGQLVDGTGVASEGGVVGVGIGGYIVDFDGAILDSFVVNNVIIDMFELKYIRSFF